MHYYLSANAAKDLGVSNFTSASEEHAEFSQHWYAHRVLIERRKCFIAMESQTRYALIFCGVTKPVLNKFPLLFADRLWRHIVSLCEVADSDFEHIKQMATNLCSDITLHKGLNKSIQAHITDVAHQLEWDLSRYGFPDDPGQEFYLCLKANQTPRTRYGEKGFILPIEEFQRLWCEILGVAPAKNERR